VGEVEAPGPEAGGEVGPVGEGGAELPGGVELANGDANGAEVGPRLDTDLDWELHEELIDRELVDSDDREATTS
jgi:hypothetical protein